jgi:LDH2 family malate/lactate/ureidoglycolate dehydrogenase
LGYYTRRLAREGLVALAFTNGSPLLTVAGQSRPLYSTNPIAFAAASAAGRLLAIDQASSATAYVNLLRAAEAGEAIPPGWAVDAQGNETRSAREALRGTLLAFGGGRGANIALMVEVLAAGLTGANWSLDAADFRSGSESPGAGMLVIGIAPRLLDECFASRLGEQMTRLETLGVYLPGKAKEQAYARAVREGISLPLSAYDAFKAQVE